MYYFQIFRAREILNDAEWKPNCTKGAGRVVIEMSPFNVWRRGQGVIGVGVGESDDDNRRVVHAQPVQVFIGFQIK